MYTLECRQDFQLTIFICKQLQVDRICTGLIVFVLQWYLHGKCTYLYCNDICMANVFALDLYLLCNCICLMTVFDLQLYKCIYLMTVFALQLYITYDCICIATVRTFANSRKRTEDCLCGISQHPSPFTGKL